MLQVRARIEAVLRRADPARVDGRPARPIPQRDPHLVAATEIYPARTQAPAPVERPRGVSATAGPQAAPSLPTSPPRQRLGDQVRQARLSRGLSLHQIERACKIRWEFLQAIEQENWGYVPRGQLRLALRTYTSYLGLDLRELIGRPTPPPHSFFPLHLAAVMAVVVVLVVVGLYLL
jgi:hypothetical protein